LLKYDSIHGPFRQVQATESTLDVGFGPIQMLAQADPTKLPWAELGIDIVLECSGRFTSKEEAAAHIQAGAKRVLISAPATNADYTVVYGVNHQNLSGEHIIVSNGSCTTNCLAPVAFVMQQHLGIEHGFMTTVHSYTADQRLVDSVHKDLHRARAAALSMIPCSTGAAKALSLVIPELKGKLDGTAIRVPTANVSMIDFTFVSQKPTTVSEVNSLMRKASETYLKDIVDYVEVPLVSVDFNHSPFSASFDATQTQLVGDRFVRVVAWYDNEWGFSNRMNDIAALMGAYL
jgi:glyceraldehyde 3-phosphate dehydrogenase